MAETIYEKYGGCGKVNRIVKPFYDTLLDHDTLGAYFEDLDMKSLIDHQTKYVASLLRGLPVLTTNTSVPHRPNLALLPITLIK